MAYAKGSTLIATMDFVREQKGPSVLGAAMSRLEPDDRSKIERCSPTEELPMSMLLSLWYAVDAELKESDPDWVERAGGHSIEFTGVRLYGGILRKSSPLEFLTQRVSLFRLYYHPGNMEVIDEDEDYAVLRLVGFDQADPLFCRRQTGGLRRALREAGGQEPEASHVRCVTEGDAFCEWECRWH